MEDNTVPYAFVEIRIVCQYFIVQEIPDKQKLDVQHRTIPKYADLTTSSIFPFLNKVFYSVLLSTLSLYDCLIYLILLLHSMGIYIKFHTSVAYHVMILLQKSRKQIYKKNFRQ